ncbi:DivIVA domain-containing protein [Mumia sp. zg.B53]|uniref:DivIVA domain-containing protein n=1 Tax=unclassified Mumia TaxID=2621872 RepID=UPI001C6E4D11|nr:MULTISPECIES: DivIVA domain-containing protein [unclassified Mumia]MBW9205856.1 DivIVA domain-containing protein [Mumia sp. zg.B17]MBW9208140.1 DivIVA domain-containing protein [Mumia sp. zg.B21]MBW9216095.1 DivIVA domain-containing protein [Mumia sp. zg.B53]MDD9348839.1 DivIVA domain-containing protein [Mumia sp.]
MTTPTDTSRISSEIRQATFTVRRRGLDEQEVGDYLSQLAMAVQRLEEDNARLRADLRTKEEEKHSEPISAQAVIMFAEAQKVADSLIDEAVTHARDLMMSARAQQRDIVRDAHDAATEAVRKVEPLAQTTEGTRYDHPIPEIEYVRTFAKVAQIQLRSVLDALTEQVDALGEMPKLETTQKRLEPPVGP